MARSPERDADDATERVVVNIDSLDELSAIREALDGIRQGMDWWINNHHREQWLPVQPIATLPPDPLAPHPAATQHQAPTSRSPTSAPAKHTAERLSPPESSADGLDDETQFCCEAPDLQWTGDARFPGVACQNCGYIVADCGSVVMQPSPQADPDPEPKEQQRALFAAE